LRVEAVGLNRAEHLFMHGQYLEPTRLPATLGYEAAGTVVAVGAGVSREWLQKKVATIPSFSLNQYGVLGEEVIVPAHSLVEYPAHLSVEEATSTWMQYMTAYGALLEIGGLQKGEVVLITAASSSAGLAAIDIVKAEGAIAIATTRTSRKRDELLALGADHVIVTDEEDLVERVGSITNGAGARIVYDPIGGPLLEKLVDVAAQGATIFQYGWLSGAPTPFPFRALGKAINVRGYWLVEIVTVPERMARARGYILEKLRRRQLKPKIAKTFRFDEVVAAYRYMESSDQVGKIVLTFGH
jgi:NADPH:quinone reductase-like Zn-dependent oxidoreductase